MNSEHSTSLVWVNANEKAKWESAMQKLDEDEIEALNGIIKDRAEVKLRLRHYIDPNYFYKLSDCYKLPLKEKATLKETIHALQTNIVALRNAVIELKEKEKENDSNKEEVAKGKRDKSKKSKGNRKQSDNTTKKQTKPQQPQSKLEGDTKLPGNHHSTRSSSVSDKPKSGNEETPKKKDLETITTKENPISSDQTISQSPYQPISPSPTHPITKSPNRPKTTPIKKKTQDRPDPKKSPQTPKKPSAQASSTTRTNVPPKKRPAQEAQPSTSTKHHKPHQEPQQDKISGKRTGLTLSHKTRPTSEANAYDIIFKHVSAAKCNEKVDENVAKIDITPETIKENYAALIQAIGANMPTADKYRIRMFELKKALKKKAIEDKGDNFLEFLEDFKINKYWKCKTLNCEYPASTVEEYNDHTILHAKGKTNATPKALEIILYVEEAIDLAAISVNKRMEQMKKTQPIKK